MTLSPSAVTEARLGLDEFDEGGWHNVKRRRPLVAAARSWVEGEEIRWCETHNAEGIENHGGASDECWRVVWAVEADQDVPEGVGYPYDLCRIVSARVCINQGDERT